MKKVICFLLVVLSLAMFTSCTKISNTARGDQFMEIGDFTNAAKSYEAAIWDNPKDAYARYKAGEAYYEMDESRRAFYYAGIAVKMGDKSLAKLFAEKALEFYQRGDGAYDDWAEYAQELDAKNATAEYLLAVSELPGYDAYPRFKKALQFGLSKTMMSEMDSLLHRNPTILTPCLYSQFTFDGDGFEDYGPVTFSKNDSALIWYRSSGRRDLKDGVYIQAFRDTVAYDIVQLRDYRSFPVQSVSDSLLYYKKDNHVYCCDVNGNNTKRLQRGFLQTPASSGHYLYTNNWNIFLADTSKTIDKSLVKRESGDMNFMPHCLHNDSLQFIYLAYNDDVKGLTFFKADTSGDKVKVAHIKDWGFNYYHSENYVFDISPDDRYLVYSKDNELYVYDMQENKEIALHVTGAYPQFNHSGDKIAMLTRRYGETGQIAVLDFNAALEVLKQQKEGKLNKNRLVRLFEQAEKNFLANS